MRELAVTRQDCTGFAAPGQAPKPAHIGTVIDETCLVTFEGKPLLSYIILPEDHCSPIRRVLKRTHVASTTRTGGLPTQGAVFGALPRVALRCDYCRYTANTRNEPENWAAMKEFGAYLSSVYQQYFPEKYADVIAEVDTINPDWRALGDIPFLSANVNMNHAIRYHRDTGNVRSALSNVFILKRGIDGGQLVLPEYGIALSQRDRALAVFDGQSVLHGCTPIKKTPGAVEHYRASIVYYTLQAMRNCSSQKEELSRFQGSRTAKELVSKADRDAKIMGMHRRKPTA